MKILAWSGSASLSSINKALLEHAVTLLPADAQVDRVSSRDLEVPFYAPDGQAAGFPAPILALKERIEAADGILLATPEYNSSVPALLKNQLDWLSRAGRPFLPGPLLLLSTSPGGRGGASVLGHLSAIVPFWGADLVGAFSLPRFSASFDGGLLDAAKAAELQGLIDALVVRARGEEP
jgi:chromate reductase